MNIEQMEILPSNYHAECMCIGCILLDNTVMYESKLQPSDFYSINLRKCYDCISKLWDERKGIDPVTLHDKVSESMSIDDIYELSSMVITATMFKEYHDIVVSCSQKRKILLVAKKLEVLVKSDISPVDIANQGVQMLELDSIEEEDKFFMDAIESYGTGSRRIIATGIHKLDSIIDGLHPGRVYIIGARPHVGKTYISCNIAQNIGSSGGKCMYFTMEMQGIEIADRIIASSCSIGYQDRLTKNAKHIAGLDIEKVKSLQENIVIKSGVFSIDDIVSKIRFGNHRDGIQVFIIDHLGLIKSKGNDTRNNEIGERTSKLKQLSLELNVAIIVLSQLNRGDKINKNAIPSMESLRDSGNIEQDADVVILLHRMTNDENMYDEKMDIYVQKNRVTGNRGNASVLIHSNTFSIIEIEHESDVKNRIVSKSYNTSSTETDTPF